MRRLTFVLLLALVTVTVFAISYSSSLSADKEMRLPRKGDKMVVMERFNPHELNAYDETTMQYDDETGITEVVAITMFDESQEMNGKLMDELDSIYLINCDAFQYDHVSNIYMATYSHEIIGTKNFKPNWRAFKYNTTDSSVAALTDMICAKKDATKKV